MAARRIAAGKGKALDMTYNFLVDTNLAIDTDDPAVSAVLREFDVAVEGSNDLPAIGRKVAAHEPDIALIPIADHHRALRKGDGHYRGLAISTSKFTGSTDLPSVLVVRKDDVAASLTDLEGESYGYINKSCTSSYFPPALMLADKGIAFDRFLSMRPTKAWQGQIDAVIGGDVRSTMVPEDVWRTTSANAETTKVIDRCDYTKPPLVVVRHDLDATLCAALTEALVRWVLPWTAVYGCYKPFFHADVHFFFHKLDELPPGT